MPSIPIGGYQVVTHLYEIEYLVWEGMLQEVKHDGIEKQHCTLGWKKDLGRETYDLHGGWRLVGSDVPVCAS